MVLHGFPSLNWIKKLFLNGELSPTLLNSIGDLSGMIIWMFYCHRILTILFVRYYLTALLMECLPFLCKWPFNQIIFCVSLILLIKKIKIFYLLDVGMACSVTIIELKKTLFVLQKYLLSSCVWFANWKSISGGFYSAICNKKFKTKNMVW